MSADGAARQQFGSPQRAILVTEEESREACRRFHESRPRQSARRTFHVTQLIAAGAFAYLAILAALHAPKTTLALAHLATFAVFSAMIAWRWWAAADLRPRLSRIASPSTWPLYTILCPIYREAHIVPDLCAALDRIDYPREALDIKFLVEADDADTVVAALACAASRNAEVIALEPASPRTKPKALNAGLARARGDFVVVYDAEDRPHPLQLRAALAAFEDGDTRLACVQAPLAIDNPDASWIARQFAAEYAIQFREILPLLARLGLPFPLGGSSNHFRTHALRGVDGWDPFNVSEDRANFANKLNCFRTRAFHIPFVSQSCASAA